MKDDDNNPRHDVSLYADPGDRLNHILDQIKFPAGHGRIKLFEAYIKKEDSTDGVLTDIPYSTIRSWFSKQMPTMKKMEMVIDALELEYNFHQETRRVKVWWKLGGEYPFNEQPSESVSRDKQLEAQLRDRDRKLTLDVMALIGSGDIPGIEDLDSDDVMKVVEKAVQFGRNFSNPTKIECPKEYLKLMMIGYLTVQNTKVSA